MQEAFGLDRLYEKNSEPVELQEPGLLHAFERKRDKRFPGIGISIDFFSLPPKERRAETVRFEIHTGTNSDEPFLDTFNVSIGYSSPVPHSNYLKRSIEILRPFEAFLSEDHNEENLHSYERQRTTPGFTRPAIIRGFHYVDEGLARSIGGLDHCLKAPAWKVERFCDGVLFQLIDGGLFDNDNAAHVEAQRRIMDYFRM